MQRRDVISTSRTFGASRMTMVLSILLGLAVVGDVSSVMACPGPSPNPPIATTAATAATATCAAKVQQHQQQQHLSTAAAASTSSSNVEPFGVPKDKKTPAFKTKSTTTTTTATSKATDATQQQHASIRVRGGALVETSTSDEVDEIVQEASVNELLVVIDFTASWCGPCKGTGFPFSKFVPVVHTLVEKWGDFTSTSSFSHI